MNCIVCECDGNYSVSVWFGAPSMHRISSLSLAWHWQLVCAHVHFMSHYGTVCSLIHVVEISCVC